MPRPVIGAKPTSPASGVRGRAVRGLAPLGGSPCSGALSRYREASAELTATNRGEDERLTRVVDWDDQPGGGPNRPPSGHAPFRSHPVQRPRSRSRRAWREPEPESARPGAERFRRAGRRSGSAGGRGRLPAPRRAGARRSPRRDGPHGRRRRPHRDRRARALGPGHRRCAAGCAARQAEPRAERCARGADPRFGRGAGGAAGRTGAAVERRRRAGGPRRQRNQHHAGRRRCELRPRSARRSAIRDFSGDQIDQALLNHVVAGIADANDADPAGTAGPLARWPGCATRPGRPRNGCPPRPRRWCPPSCPASPPTSG